MLLNRTEISEDKASVRSPSRSWSAIRRRRPICSSRWCATGGSIGDALSIVTAAEAPFVNVPCHINIKDGNIALTNNDHTLLGLRASAYLMPYLPEKYRLLPMLQSVWYIGAGLDIWNQLLFKYPGRYATMKGVQVPPPSYGPSVWLEDTPPIHEDGHGRGAAPLLHDRDDDRRLAPRARPVPRPGRRPADPARACRKPSSSSA